MNSESRRLSASGYISGLAANRRYHFTTREAQAALGVSAGLPGGQLCKWPFDLAAGGRFAPLRVDLDGRKNQGGPFAGPPSRLTSKMEIQDVGLMRTGYRDFVTVGVFRTTDDHVIVQRNPQGS